jgi:hypothetical protein
MIIIDYFLYNGEPIIEFRLKYLNEYVDKFREVTTFFRVFPNFIFPNLGKLGNFPKFFPVFGGPILEPPKLPNRVDFPLLGKLGKLGKSLWTQQN